MGRIDWLRDMGTAFGQAVLAIALEIWVNLEGKRRMGRMDWADGGERNGWEGYRGEKYVYTQKDSCMHKTRHIPLQILIFMLQ